MESPSASARESGFNKTRPTPSLRTKPSAEASQNLQRPSAASMPAREKAMLVCGDNTRFDPPASAAEHSPLQMLRHARCTATSDELRSVSTTRLGPRRPSRYE